MNNIHKKYGGSFDPSNPSTEGIIPGIFLGMTLSYSKIPDGTIVTYVSEIQGYFIDPSLWIEGKHFLKVNDGRSWITIEKV